MEDIPNITRKDADALIDFIRSKVRDSGSDGVVIGLSGGLDSAVVAKLSVDALGPESVMCLFMPSKSTPKEDYDITYYFSSELGAEYEVIDISQINEDFKSLLGLKEDDRLAAGNISARCRMTVLYDRAKRMNSLVVGTSNKSELMMGYFTKYGDGACDIRPLANLYKTQVRELARIIGIPEEFIVKPPTAGLWPGQTDENEMGITYAELDHVLYGMESGMSDREIFDRYGVQEERTAEVRLKFRCSEHKRMPAGSP